jgi:hypothetical protein
VAAQQKKSQHFRIAQRFQNFAHGEEVAQRFRHLLVIDAHETVVHPHVNEWRVARGAGLGDLVLMVGKLQVLAAAVQIEIAAEQAGRHGRALDVPAGPAVAPGRCPGGLAGLGVLPEDEIQGIELRIVDLHPGPCAQVVDFLAGELSVLREFPHRVHDIAVARDVRVALVDQGLRHRDDGVDEFGGARFEVGRLQPESRAVLVHGGGETPCQIGPILAVGGRALDDLVVDVGDVAHIGDGVAQGSQVALDQVEHREHARVADVDVVVIRHAAHVHADLIGPQRLEFLFFPGQRIMYFQHGTSGAGAPSPAA